MATLRAHGIRADLPAGFEGRIFRHETTGPERSHAVAHFATFALPAEVGDFGGGAVTLMRETDVFAVLFEYGPESLGTPLFDHPAMPRALGPEHFAPHVLRRGLVGQAGTQWFFTENGRPFTLYVVLGSFARRRALVPVVNRLLAQLAVEPAAAPAPGGAPWN